MPPNENAHRPHPTPGTGQPQSLVLTPGGWRPRSQVHLIEDGHHVTAKGGRLAKIHTASGKLVQDFGDVSRTNFSRAEASRRALHADFPLPDIGWIQNTGWSNGTGKPIAYFSTKWVVPPPPASNDNQVIFLFNGMEQSGSGANPGGPYILQPVLQWGVSAAGGGAYWSITNWYVNGQNGTALYKTLIQVNPGDVLQGVMTLTGGTGPDYDYLSSFVGHTGADLTVTNAAELKWACETLECYGATSQTPLAQCSDYPNTPVTTFFEIEIKVGSSVATSTEASLSWSEGTSFTGCGQSCQVVSNASPGGIVDVCYNQGAFGARVFEAATTFGNESDGTWLMSAWSTPGGKPDLVFLKTNNTPNNHVEVHVASAASNYQTRVLETPTTFGNETDGTWLMAPWSAPGGKPDLIFIKTNGTPNGHVEVHVASAASDYQTRVFEKATTFANETDGTWLMANWSNPGGPPDLIFIKTNNTPSGRVEVHVASAESEYQTRVLETPTTFANENDGIWLMTDWSNPGGKPDLVFIKTSNTPSGHVEVHIASAASNYQTRVIETATTFVNESDGTWTMATWLRPGGKPDLVFIKTNNTPNGHVEVHVAAGAP
jgi:hypothetical protein